MHLVQHQLFRDFPHFEGQLPEPEALPLPLISTDVFLSDPELCENPSNRSVGFLWPFSWLFSLDGPYFS